MCVPHGASQNLNSGARIKRAKEVQKSIPKMSKDQFEKGDPGFKDERVKKYAPEEKASKGWLESLLGG